MNTLIVGTDKSDISKNLPTEFMMIDDGAIIDTLTFPPTFAVNELDLSFHAFNPLKNIDYKRACDFVSLINALFPEGEQTLTRRSSNLVLLRALLSAPDQLETLITLNKQHPGTVDAFEKIARILLSPTLKPFLTRTTNFSLKGVVLVRLDSSIPAFDRKVIGNLLISNYQGSVVIPNFGFYACPFHASLIEEGRISIGVHNLNEVPWLQNCLHHFQKDDVHPMRCNAEDADTLATHFSGKPKGTDGYSSYVALAMGIS
jgi:hypothetical protein